MSEIVTVEDRTVYVYGEVMCTWLARAEAVDYAADLRRHFARAIAEEREACARIGDAIVETKDHPIVESRGAEWMAAAIRARGEAPEGSAP